MPGPKGEKVSAAPGAGGEGAMGIPGLPSYLPTVGVTQLQLLSCIISPNSAFSLFYPARGNQEDLGSQEILGKM